MNRSLTLFFAIAAAVAGFGVEVRAVDPPSEPRPGPSAEEIRGWISGLSSNRFEVREAATKQLERAGSAAVQPLSDAARGESLEVTCRAIRALEEIADRGDPLTFERAQGVLEQLAESPNRSVARRADVALRGLAGARRRYALAKVAELGGIVKPLGSVKGIEVPSDNEASPLQIILNKRWKGGDAGLIHLRRIDELHALIVAKGASVSRQALADLNRDVPRLQIQERGEAMLGVMCLDLGTEVVINRIAEGSAAEKAGLVDGDTIVKYDGVPITQFKRLIEITSEHSAGDKIVIDILRDGEPLKVEAVLTEWR